jgi:Mn-dependent DtxR family transcriptional regulator
MMGDCTFFSNYGHVLVCLARNNEVRLRDVALEVGITERAVQKIVKDMQDAGFLTINKQGRRNRYQINRRKSLRHGLESHCNVGKLLALLSTTARENKRAKARPLEKFRRVTAEGDSRAAAEIETRYPSQGKKAADKSSREESDSKSEPVDTRQQGNLF